ncbi:alpha-amylase family glycosyl hydrolase [Tunicatimonas pelagia]|uniref:alpha-amylase family glycosyl hydrolase n=1 Tax=Tunicatimonas pelagia TaxID=931531 RepID=UPI00266551CD|nr:alpha-amylase family glycosyl hydrolase [Tunicatimonas pelagia]WKN41344.1 alpha-amylase family glycosyl hydrolase [Tunicatimonas pelagia]
MRLMIISGLCLTLLIAACQPQASPTTEVETDTVTTEQFPEKASALTVYEVNIRQHTAEGTLSAFIDDMPRLQEMGIGILWIMPVQPIGKKNRKGTLGSYYSISDYRTVNPEFGTADDFQRLVDTAHEMGMYVILDWVPNHTAWDHPWITEHPDYYAKDEEGNITYEADWTDIALLDHTNSQTRREMIADMKYWVEKFNIDGFRCDHAGHEIPLYFWEEATAELDPIKDLFWLAEWDGARMHLEFDATYAWELLHLTDKVGKGEANADTLANWILKDLQEYGQHPLRMTMITNHDENSWNGTVFERYGDGHQTFAAFIFSAYGIPMLYSGQEVGLDKRLKFFEKDTIDWSDSQQLQPFYTKLVALKKENPALWAGKVGGFPQRINEGPDVYAFKRQKDNNSVIGVMNFSAQPQELQLTDASVVGTYTDYFTEQSYELSTEAPLTLAPWQYLIFAQN